MVASIAPVREMAAQARIALADEDVERVDRLVDNSAIRRLVLTMTTTEAVTTAVFFFLGTQAWRRLRRQRQLAKEVTRLAEEQEALEAQAGQLDAAAVSLRQGLVRVDEMAEAECQRFQDAQRCVLLQRLDRIRSAQSAEQHVDTRLREHSGPDLLALAHAG